MCDEVTKSENVSASRKRGDAVTASPRPWRVNGHSIEANDPDGLWLQNENTGCGVVANLPSCPKSRMSKKNRDTWDAIVEANARLIVDAVNLHDVTREDRHKLQEANEELFVLRDERDRLRDLVRRFANNISRFHLVGVRERALLREARAAIGEDKE